MKLIHFGHASTLAGITLSLIGAAVAADSPPVINSFSPLSGRVGIPVTVSGANFSSVPAENFVYFGGVPAAVTSASSNALVVTAPGGGSYLPITVTRGGLTAASRVPFVATFNGRDEPQFSQAFLSGGVLPLVGDLDRDGRIDITTLIQVKREFGFDEAPTFQIGRNLGPQPNTWLATSLFRLTPDFSDGRQIFGTGSAMVDLDGDGYLDLVLNESAERVVAYRNVGSNAPLDVASFTPPLAVTTPGLAGTDLAAGDLDGDGRPDLVVNNGLSIGILRGTGNVEAELFSPPVLLQNVPGYQRHLADLDGDGRLEIICIGNGAIQILRNLGTGPGLSPASFSAPIRLNLGEDAQFLAVGDLDGDGRPDLVTASAASYTLRIFRNLSLGPGLSTNTFAQRTALPLYSFVDAGPTGLAVGDLNGDGQPEIIVLQKRYVSVFANHSSPGLLNSNTFAVRNDIPYAAAVRDPYPTGLLIADFDGDGRNDITFSDRGVTGFTFRNTTPPPPNQPPNVSILSPASGTTLTAPANVPIAVDVSDHEGTVLQVSFFTNGNLLGTTDTSPFVFTWTNVPPGDYTLTATAIDNEGAAATSAPINIVVAPPPVPPSILVAPQSKSIEDGAPATFNVTASGTAPLSFQWLFNGTNLPGATNDHLTFNSVSYASAGAYSVRIRNDAGVVTSQPAVLSVLPLDGRLLQLAPASGLPGSIVTVPIQLVGLGNENAVSFSLSFSPSVLAFVAAAPAAGFSSVALNVNSSQASPGQLGLSFALPAGAAIPAGTNAIIEVQFEITASVGTTFASLSFSDAPVPREFSDPLAETLRSSYLGGTIAITGAGFEGDVTPLPDGNGAVTATDWVKIGRYAAKLDPVPNASQFQRADCAPRSSFGNGAITVTDWVQTGRYAAGLDPLTPAGGPVSAPAPVAAEAGDAFAPANAPSRTVLIPTTGLQPGQTNRVPIRLTSLGNETAVGLSVAFDPSVLTFIGANPGSNAPGALLNLNTSQVSSGRLGLVMTLPIPTSFAAGTQEMLQLLFTVPSGVVGQSSLAFSDQPVVREISDSLANVAAAGYASGTLVVAPRLDIHRAGSGHVVSFPAWARAFRLESTGSLAPPTSWIPAVTAGTNVANGELQVTVPGSGLRQFFRLRLP